MPRVIDINEVPAPSGKRYAVAWLDEPLDVYGNVVLVGLRPIMTLCASTCLIDPANMGNCYPVSCPLDGASHFRLAPGFRPTPSSGTNIYQGTRCGHIRPEGPRRNGPVSQASI